MHGHAVLSIAHRLHTSAPMLLYLFIYLSYLFIYLPTYRPLLCPVGGLPPALFYVLMKAAAQQNGHVVYVFLHSTEPGPPSPNAPPLSLIRTECDVGQETQRVVTSAGLTNKQAFNQRDKTMRGFIWSFYRAGHGSPAGGSVPPVAFAR